VEVAVSALTIYGPSFSLKRRSRPQPYPGRVEDPGIDPSQAPTPWRQLVVPLGVCGTGIFVGVLLKSAGNTSILGSVVGFISYVALIAIRSLVAYAITGHN
jgi:hypothetical protein